MKAYGLRINKAIARSGLCSRRAADELIAAQKVKVNGKVVTDFNLTVDLRRDKVLVNGKQLFAQSYQYVLLNKSKAIISTCQDELGRKSIIDLLPKNLSHLKPAGRLDSDSTGLILLTNNGMLIQAITHPKKEILKTYLVTVSGKVKPETINKLASGIKLKEGITQKAIVRLINTNEYQSTIKIAISEGKNRQIRRMCAQLGLIVTDLVRIGIGKLQLGKLPSGHWRYLTKEEIKSLQKELKLDLS